VAGASRTFTPQISGYGAGYAVEPTAQRGCLANGSGLAGEDQERGLPGVLGVVWVTERPPAHAEDQRSVAFDEHGESGVVLVADESLQQLAVAQFPAALHGRDLANVSHYFGNRVLGHGNLYDPAEKPFLALSC